MRQTGQMRRWGNYIILINSKMTRFVEVTDDSNQRVLVLVL
jgi:hypothetical protein